jgi:hypothetical protein
VVPDNGSEKCVLSSLHTQLLQRPHRHIAVLGKSLRKSVASCSPRQLGDVTHEFFDRGTDQFSEVVSLSTRQWLKHNSHLVIEGRIAISSVFALWSLHASSDPSIIA